MKYLRGSWYNEDYPFPSERERRILEMKFFEGRNGVEVAKELCISQGRVSQITKTALEKLKKAYLLRLEKGFKS